MTEQIRLRTLLREDPIYRAWFQKPPLITVVHSTPPWRVFIQEEQGGKWKRGETRGYPKAYGIIAKLLNEAHDLTISCKPQGFKPPVLKIGTKRYYMPMPEGHRWCMYCRRPTVFGYFTKHHNIPTRVDPEIRRCGICGARAISQREFASPLSWPAR